ncbi:MAG TPA: LuxR C-terminal-related transcriptional regulator [Polyangiaceae bacterium]|nr:LuxR C-terminal-related transcriptional regulator [Polyangiaceae bacterium]
MAAASFDPAFSRFWAGALADKAEAFDPFARYPNFVGTSTALVGSKPVPEQLSAFQAALGASDILGLVALAGDTSLAMGVPSPTTIKLSSRDRWLLTQVTLHLETALRLRTQPQTEVARLSPTGALLDVSDPSLSTQGVDGVRRHVARVERGRTRQERKELAAVDAWTALVSGRWVLVERAERGLARHYAIFEAGRGHALRALREQEARAVELSARGLAGKCTAYALGVTPGTVSKLLASAALKLGLPNRTRLTQLVGALLGVAPPIDSTARLTPSEREVLDLLRLGYSNARIAAARGRSERTVANQVAFLLQKLKVPSRRALGTLRSTGAQ